LVPLIGGSNTGGQYQYRKIFGYELSKFIVYPGTKQINAEQFSNHVNLTNITIPTSVILIKHKAFNNCANVVSVNIHPKYSLMESTAFDGCTSLQRVSIFFQSQMNLIVIPSSMKIILPYFII
jgi:hypothetical protein